MATQQQNQNYDYETTGELLLKTGQKKRRSGAKYVAVALIAVAAIAGVIGFILRDNAKYAEQVEIATKCFEEGDYEQAEIEFTAAVAMQPRKVSAREGLAYTKAVNSKFTEARDLYKDLYDDTGDEKYKDAMEDTADGRVPGNDELKPSRNKKPDKDEAPEDTVANEASTSNSTAGGKVAFGNGQIYYIIGRSQSYYDYVSDSSSSIYAADPDGGNQRLLYSLTDGSEIRSILYQEGILYAIRIRYDYENDYNVVNLLELDPADGRTISTHTLGTNLWFVNTFFIEGHYCICEVEWGDGYDYPLSIDLETGEKTALMEYVFAGDSPEAYCRGCVCRNGWVWITEGLFHYEYDEATDTDHSRTGIRLFRIRPDGSGREVLLEEWWDEDQIVAATDLSICGQKLYFYHQKDYFNEDGEYESAAVLVRVFDLQTLKPEAVYELSGNSADMWMVNNVDGNRFYALYADNDAYTYIRTFDLENCQVRNLVRREGGYAEGVYCHDGRIYIPVNTYYYDEVQEREFWADSLCIYDMSGDPIIEIE